MTHVRHLLSLGAKMRTPHRVLQPAAARSVSSMPAGMDAATIMREAPDAIVAVDTFDRVTFWNRGAHELLGYSASDAIGQSLTELIVPLKHREKHLSGFARVMAGEQSKYGRRDLLRVPAMCKDGSKVAVEFTLQLITDPGGNPTYSVAFMRDVSVMSGTIRKLRERVAELEKATRQAQS